MKIRIAGIGTVIALALVFLAGSAPEATAANGCVKNGTVAGSCTLDANYAGTITISTANTTLDCANHSVWANSDFVVKVENARTVTIKNCRVTNGRNGIAVTGSRYVTLTNNYVAYNQGIAVYAYNSGDVTVSGGTFEWNSVTGLYVSASYNVNIRNVTIQNNVGTGLFLTSTNNVHVENVRVFDNGHGSDSSLPGLSVNNGCYLWILGSRFGGESGTQGPHVLIRNTCNISIQNNTFLNGPREDITIEDARGYLYREPNTYQ